MSGLKKWEDPTEGVPVLLRLYAWLLVPRNLGIAVAVAFYLTMVIAEGTLRVSLESIGGALFTGTIVAGAVRLRQRTAPLGTDEGRFGHMLDRLELTPDSDTTGLRRFTGHLLDDPDLLDSYLPADFERVERTEAGEVWASEQYRAIVRRRGLEIEVLRATDATSYRALLPPTP